MREHILFFSTSALVFALIFAPYSTRAQLMTSTNYQIVSQTVNFGALSTSTNYRAYDVGGETFATTTDSASYKVQGGFLGARPTYRLTVTFSKANIALETLSSGAIASDSLTMTVTTNGPNGYTTTIRDDGNLRDGSNDINDVTDNTVTAGAEEYGVSTSGSDGQLSNDTAITTSAQTIARRTSPVYQSQTGVTFEASITDNTSAGSYAHTVTFTTSAGF